MRSATSVKFDIESDEYQIFRFDLRRTSRLRIRVVASEPVNVLLLNRDELRDYESDDEAEVSVTARWDNQVDLEVMQRVAAGRWSVVIEGEDERSVGIVELRA